MAELAAFIGVAASVVGIASEGVKLSQTLNTYIAKVKYADRDVSGIANDVKETATVLVQLGDNLKLEEQSMICKPEFYETTNENVTSCEKIFKEIEAALSELVNIVVDEKGGPRSVELKSKVRFKWPFKRTQFTLLRTDLDRLKANLGLMISVMRHARELHEKEILDKQNAIGRRIETLKIQTLELETEAAEARFHDVKRRAEMAKEHLKSQQNVDDDDVEDCIDGATLNEDIERDGLNSSQQQPIPVVPMNGLTGQDYLPPPDRGTLGHGATNLAKTNLQTGMGNADSNEGPRPETANPSHKNRSYVEAATDWSKLEGLLVRIATAQEILAGSPESSVHQRQSKSRKRSDLQVHNHVKGRISGRPSDHQNKRSGKELPRASSEDDTDLQPGESGDNSSRNGSRSSDVRPETGNLPIEEKVTKIPGSPYKPSLAGSEVPSKASQACLLVLGLPSSPNAAEHYSSEYDTENHLKGSPLTHSESGSPTWGNVKAANDVRRNSADQEARGISRQKEGKDRVKYHQDEETVLPVDEMPIVLRKSDKRPFSRVEKGKWREGDDYHFGGAATKVSDDEAKTLRIIELSHEQKPAEGYVMQEKVCGINREGNQRTEQSTDVDPREVKLPMTDDQADSEVVDLKRRDSQAPPQQVSSDPDVLVVSSIKSRGRWKNRFVRMRNKSKLLPARLLPSSDTQQGDAIDETKSTGNSIRETIEGNMAQPAQQPPIVDGSAASPENMVNDSRSPGTLPHGPHLPSRATHHLSTPLGVDPSNPAGLHQPIYHEQFEIGNVANLVVPPIPLVYNPAQDHLRILEAWVFRRADILKQSKDWGNVSRNLLPLDPQELNETVSNQEKKGNKIWESFSVLSSYQQRQIQLLLYDKHCQFDHSSPNSVNRFVWTLKALKTDPKRAKTVDIRSIQIIIERKMQLGGQSQVTSIPYAPPVPLGHVGNSMQMHPVPRLRSHEASHRQQAHVSFAAEPADISQGPSRRTTYDDDFDRDSFMRRSRDNVKERSSSDTGPWDSQRGNSSSRPSYSENVALGAHAARKSSKEKKRMHKIKESILDLEDEMVDIDHRLEQRFDKLEDKLDKQLALRQTGSPIANRAQNGGLKETKLTSVDGVYYSPAGAPLKALNSQPPLPSPDKFGVTVDSLLSKWTIVEGIHGNTAAPVNNSRVSLQRRSAPYLSSLHKSTTARRPSSRQRLSKSFKDNRQHTESGPRFSDSHMSSSDLIDDMD